ncbi:MAG TPA: porin [Vicinamibacterales bacterium]|nr:porin [Vicinamibacterales bacterium]
MTALSRPFGGSLVKVAVHLIGLALVLGTGSPQALALAAGDPRGESGRGEAPREEDAPAATPLNGSLTNLQFGGLIQGWYLAASGSATDTFRLRRAELKLSANLGSKASWLVMVDPSKSLSMNREWIDVEGRRVLADVLPNQASRILQDAFITLTGIPRVEISVGQFKLPLGFEGLESSAALGTVERALFLTDRTRGGTYGDVRDLGAMVKGKAGGAFEYRVGFFNGAGQTQNDVGRPDGKMIAGRLVAHPGVVPGLTVGISAGRGLQGCAAARQDRTGFDAQYVHDALTLRAELMAGRDGSTRRVGYYAHAAYRVAPDLEVVLRYDSWDPDRAGDATAAAVEERDYVAGASYFLDTNVKWQVNVLRKTFTTGVVPTRTQLTTNLQVSW